MRNENEIVEGFRDIGDRLLWGGVSGYLKLKCQFLWLRENEIEIPVYYIILYCCFSKYFITVSNIFFQ